MKRYVLLLLFLLSLLTGCQQEREVLAEVQMESAGSGSSVQSAGDRQKHMAMLTDTRDLYRICTTRPQRVLPSQGAQQRTNGKSAFAVRPVYVPPSNTYYDSRCRMESAPFCFVASRDYYIIALRRILR